jgi:hypothetical protein
MLYLVITAWLEPAALVVAVRRVSCDWLTTVTVSLVYLLNPCREQARLVS